MDGAEQRILGELRLHLVGDAAHLGPIRPHHAHLHRPAGRRPEEQAVDLGADRGEILGQDGAQLDDQPFARRLVIGHDQQLGVVRIAQLLVERQEEARRALADIGGDEALVGVVHHPRFQRLGLPSRLP